MPSKPFNPFRSQSTSSATHRQAASLHLLASQLYGSFSQPGIIMRSASRYVTLLLAALSVARSGASDSCQPVLSGSYSGAVVSYPNLKDQIELVAKQQVAQWYTDRVSDVSSLAQSVVLPKCDVDSQDASPPTIVVYGLPQKDCANGYSSGGSNANADDYRAFLQQLSDAAGDRQVVYILEPDAIGLLADGGCGNDKGYAANLGVAINILSQNANAEIYLDVGYWTVSDDEQAAAVAQIVKTVDPDSKCKGISLNTSNYRSNAEMVATCERFVKATGRNYKCIVDSSRNFVAPVSTEWCNANWAGIGELPTSNTGSDVVSRYVWVKPPGESDGECTSESSLALRGPSAGTFFPDHFVQLWDNGVFVQKLGQAAINAAANTTTNSATVQTEAPAATPAATPASTSVEQVATQDVETSLATLNVTDDTLGQVHAGDDESSGDNGSETAQPTAVPTTPTPSSTAPVAVEVELPRTMVVVDVTPDDNSGEESNEDSFSGADEALLGKHKACV